MNKRNKEKQNKKKFLNLSFLHVNKYIIGFVIIAILLLITQLVTNTIISSKEYDSKIINMSGRQRMLSQRIIREVTGFYTSTSSYIDDDAIRKLEDDLYDLVTVQTALRYGDESLGIIKSESRTVLEKYEIVDISYRKVIESVSNILDEVKKEGYNHEFLLTDIEIITVYSDEFLNKMDDIVSSYEEDSTRKLLFLKTVTWVLFTIVMIVLIIELLFVYVPLENKIKESISKLKDNEKDLTKIFDISPSAMLLINKEDLSIVKVNVRTEKTLNVNSETLLKKKVSEIILFNDSNSITKEYLDIFSKESKNFEVNLKTTDSKLIHVLIGVEELSYKNTDVYVIGITDISERKRNEMLLEKFAQIDEMTKFYNRHTGITLIEKEIATIKRTKDEMTIVFLDLDNLKMVNDTFGHAEGDLFINNFSCVTLESIREEDVAIRYGGDEFVLMLKRCSNANAKTIVSIIRKKLNEIGKLKEYDIEFSVGYSTYDTNNPLEITELIAEADSEMYDEKMKKKN